MSHFTYNPINFQSSQLNSRPLIQVSRIFIHRVRHPLHIPAILPSQHTTSNSYNPLLFLISPPTTSSPAYPLHLPTCMPLTNRASRLSQTSISPLLSKYLAAVTTVGCSACARYSIVSFQLTASSTENPEWDPAEIRGFEGWRIEDGRVWSTIGGCVD
jgi:hypothetical protein